VLISAGLPGPAVSLNGCSDERANASDQRVLISCRSGRETVLASCTTYGRARRPKRWPWRALEGNGNSQDERRRTEHVIALAHAPPLALRFYGWARGGDDEVGLEVDDDAVR